MLYEVFCQLLHSHHPGASCCVDVLTRYTFFNVIYVTLVSPCSWFTSILQVSWNAKGVQGVVLLGWTV